MGGNIMKLISLTIEGLYKSYNYKVDFNSDVTFIFGANGCGKTTVLNITEAIITGQLFKLFSYKFKNIELKYAKTTELECIKTIFISSNNVKLNIEFNKKEYVIKILDLENNIRLSKNIRQISHFYFNRYDFLFDIRETFNYVYLPLNRSYVPYDESEDFYSYRRFRNGFIEDDIYFGNQTPDGAMIKIESLIYQNYSSANAKINKINDTFRNNILKSQIEISNKTYDFQNFFDEIEKTSIPSLQKIQEAYIKILKELNLIDKSEEENYNKFFTNFINDFSRFLETKKEGIPFELFFKLQEISKIQKTIDMAKKMEKQKSDVIKPIETFLNTMNSFIGNSDDGKELCINNDGQIYFKTKYSKNQISIQHLSSGEKQLITFFANLIFMVKGQSSGIFVVDEPELSLHLLWQKIFIDKVLEINNNIQLIFATHAPEIIGARRNKMYKLEKQYQR